MNDYADSPGDGRAGDPNALLREWLKLARGSGDRQVDSMALATASADGRPSLRMVLHKEVRDTGVVFVTDYRSRKASELSANPHAAGLFYWPSLHRQVRIEGIVTRLSLAESDEYWRSRPRESQVSAAASIQSAALASRSELEDKVLAVQKTFADREIARPPDWGGYLIAVDRFEFWTGHVNRLHHRLEYIKIADGWESGILSP